MKILTDRTPNVSFSGTGELNIGNPFGQHLYFGDGTTEWDEGCTQTTPILTAELYNGKAAKTEGGEWVPAPGPRSEYELEYHMLGFQVQLQFVTIDSDGKVVYDYHVTTPTGVIFHGDWKDNVLHVPRHWTEIRAAAEAIAWICTGEDSGLDFPDTFTHLQWEWIRSDERESASAEIDEWIDAYDRDSYARPVEPPTTEDEPESKGMKIALAAKRYREQNILACQSSLVSFLLEESNHVSWDDVRNVYPNPNEMDATEAANYINDEMGGDWKELVCKKIHRGKNKPDFGYMGRDGFVESDDLTPDLLADQDIETLSDYIHDNAEPQEIYEWWLVDEWLHDQLETIGEPVLTDGQSHWWGRTCTGQAIYLDGTLQKIAIKYA